MSCGKSNCQQQKCKMTRCTDDVNLGITFDKCTNRYNVKLNGCDAGSCASRTAGLPLTCTKCVTLCPPSCPEPHCLSQCPTSCQAQGPPIGCCMEKCALPRCPFNQNPCNDCKSKSKYNRW